MRFEHQRGKYMMHCHNLVHEDHDMMHQFEVGYGGDDPLHADPSQAMPAGPLFVRRDEDDGGTKRDDPRSNRGPRPREDASSSTSYLNVGCSS